MAGPLSSRIWLATRRAFVINARAQFADSLVSKE